MVNHPIQLRGCVFNQATGAPVPTQGGAVPFVERQDQQFVLALLGELSSAEGRQQLARTVISNGTPVSGTLKLLQPVHGVHNLALMEAYCDILGEPRVAPSHIESAGLVIRRIGLKDTRQAWMRRNGKVLGWVTLNGPEELDRDPNPAYRDGPVGPGPAEVRRELLRRMGVSNQDEESMTSLFVAPPEACSSVGRTLLYGLVQVASGEAPDGDTSPAPGYTREEIIPLIAPYFTSGKLVDWTGLAGLNVSHEVVAKRRLPAAVHDKLLLFIELLRGLMAVFDAFQNKPLMDAMNRVQLEYDDKVLKPAGTLLSQAADILLLAKAGTVKLPNAWPTVSTFHSNLIIDKALAATPPRMKQIIPAERRFEARDARYVARAFVRIRRDDGCPPKIVWSPESVPFTIAAWHEKGKLPPVLVSLPALKDLSAFKPNVTFKVPNNLFNLLGQNEPKDFLEGAAKPAKGEGLGIDWLCGFNIPLITLCAFIVLTIFLTLLNIVFFWLPLIKICIPIPRALTQRFKD